MGVHPNPQAIRSWTVHRSVRPAWPEEPIAPGGQFTVEMGRRRLLRGAQLPGGVFQKLTKSA